MLASPGQPLRLLLGLLAPEAVCCSEAACSHAAGACTVSPSELQGGTLSPVVSAEQLASSASETDGTSLRPAAAASASLLSWLLAVCGAAAGPLQLLVLRSTRLLLVLELWSRLQAKVLPLLPLPLPLLLL